MAKYEVTIGGKTWHCDTLSEARALEKKHAKVRNGTDAPDTSAAGIRRLSIEANNLRFGIEPKRHGEKGLLGSAIYRLDEAIRAAQGRQGLAIYDQLANAMQAVRAALPQKRLPLQTRERTLRDLAHTEYRAEPSREATDENTIYAEKIVDLWDDVLEGEEGSGVFSDWNYVSSARPAKVTITGRVWKNSKLAAEVSAQQLLLLKNPRKRRNPEKELPPSPLKTKRPKGYNDSTKTYFPTYLFTMVAPKCRTPVEFFSDGSNRFSGFTPEGVWYGTGYFGNHDNGCRRQHMQPGLANYSQDQGTGIGPALYMAGPVAAFARYRDTCTFSPDGTDGRSDDANEAWHKLVAHGTAEEFGTRDDDDDPEDVPEETEINVADYIVAGKGAFVDWASIDSIEPTTARVFGYSYGEPDYHDRGFQRMQLEKIVEMSIILHCEPTLWQAISAEFPRLDGDEVAPPAGGWATIDLALIPAASVNKYIEFCAELQSNPQEYIAQAYTALADNSSAPKSADSLAALVQNPKRKMSSKTAAKTAAWNKMMSDDLWSKI